jgi:hypothetical protein
VCVEGSYKSRWLRRSTWTFTSHLSRRQHSSETEYQLLSSSSSRLQTASTRSPSSVGYPTPPTKSRPSARSNRPLAHLCHVRFRRLLFK